MNTGLARLIYFGLQSLRREPIQRALNDVKRTEFISQDELRDIQAERQLRQLKHAINYVDYYRRAYAELTSDIHLAKDWEDVNQIMHKLPVLQKGSIMVNPEQFLSSNNGKIKTYLDKTSGSTGTPVIFPCDQTAWAYRHALTFRCMQSYGVEIGEPYAYFWGLHWNKRIRLEVRLRDWVMNRVRVSAYSMIPSNIDKYLRQLEHIKPTHFLGYPSALYDFCSMISERGLDLSHLKLKAIFLTAEPVFLEQRKLIEGVTFAKCVNIYGSAEGGLNAFECPHGSLHITSEATWLQTLENDVVSGTAVVTDMFLFAFPIIKYLIEDEIVLKPGVCSCDRPHPMLESVIGRSGDPIVLPNGRVISAQLPTYIFKPLAQLGVIRRYRFVDNPSQGLHLYLIVSTKFTEEHRKLIEKEIHSAFGADINCNIQIVDSIPYLANAKHRCYVKVVDNIQ